MELINQNTISSGEYLPRFTPGTPFLIEGCMILQCLNGNASFIFNFKRYEICPGDVVFLFNDMVIELGERSDDFTVRYVSVTNERVFELYVRIASQKLWNKLYLSPVLKIEDLYKEPFDKWMRQCLWVEKNCCKQTSDSIIANAVLSLFMVMEDIINKNEEDVAVIEYCSQWKLLGGFFVLLSRHYMTRHNVSFYAESLNITSDYLSVLMKEYIGKTPKEIIDEKLVLAMKALLESTGLSIKNIADRLHYEDSSHLCKVFRRHTGMSPAQYRKSLSK